MLNIYLRNKLYTLFIGILFIPFTVSAQDDLMNMLDQETEKKSEKVLATFKTSRIVNAHSVETVKGKHLDFRVTHHFGNVGGSSGGYHTFFGLEQASDIRIAFEYGITDQFTAGLGRNKIGELLDGYLKYRLLHQTEDNKIPLSVTLFANTGFSSVKSNNREETDFVNRFSYSWQALLARKFSSKFSWQIMPTLIHRNYVPVHNDQNDLFAIGTGGRLKLSKRFALLVDYYFIFSDLRNQKPLAYFPPLGLGVEIETGGHIFHLFFTNNPAITENNYLTNTTESWGKGQFKFGFTISRTFSFKGKEEY